MGQDHLWNGTESLLLVEDPAQREVVATVGSVEVTQVELFLDFDVAVGMIEAGSEREVLRSKSFLYNTEYPVGHLEQLLSRKITEGILLGCWLAVLALLLVVALHIDFNVLGGYLRATLWYCGGSRVRYIVVGLGHLFNFGGTFMNFTQAQRIDEIDPALIIWIRRHLSGCQLPDIRERVLILPVAGPVRIL